MAVTAPTAIVCDDDPSVRRVAAAMLADAGLQVIAEVDQGYDLLELLDLRAPDLLVLDIALRSGNGIELLPKILELAPGLKVIVFSGFPDLRGASEQAGAHAFVTKPDVDGLRRAIGQLVGSPMGD